MVSTYVHWGKHEMNEATSCASKELEAELKKHHDAWRRYKGAHGSLQRSWATKAELEAEREEIEAAIVREG